MNPSRCIITTASNKFVPSLLNLIGSLKTNYPHHPTIYVYDLGISSFLKRNLEKIENVFILPMPHFVPFWRSCYTWKTYILNTSLADLNFYIDAGTEVLRPLDELFKKIDTQTYLAISQGPIVKMKDITPKEYLTIFNSPNDLGEKEIIAAGIFGFKKNSEVSNITEKVYAAGKAGLCIGFSKGEQWKNKGKNKNIFIRDCSRFRHDTTILSILLYTYMPHITVEPIELFDGMNHKNETQYLWSVRMNFSHLEYTDTAIKSANNSAILKVFVRIFLYAKAINKTIKKFLFKTK